jgi:hypothetical protein
VFERLAALKTHLPQASAVGVEGKPERQPTGIVELRVFLQENGIRLEGTLSHTPDGKEKELYEDVQYDIPLKGEEYDLDRLRQILLSFKQQYPRHDEIVLMVDDTIPYDVIVQTMDTCREEVFEEQGQVRRNTLFPRIALSEAFDESKGFDGIRKGTGELDKKLGIQ